MGLVDRVRNILLTPKTEWAIVDAEPAGVPEIFTQYVMPLAAIPAVAGFIGGSLVGIGIPGVGTVRIGFFSGLLGAVLQYVLLLAFASVLALIVDALAPVFGGRKDFPAAFKAAAYSSTPAWLAGIFSIVPAFAFLGVVGLYGVYLLYLGLPRLMRVPEAKSAGYAAAIVGALAFVASGVLGLVAGVRLFV